MGFVYLILVLTCVGFISCSPYGHYGGVKNGALAQSAAVASAGAIALPGISASGAGSYSGAGAGSYGGSGSYSKASAASFASASAGSLNFSPGMAALFGNSPYQFPAPVFPTINGGSSSGDTTSLNDYGCASGSCGGYAPSKKTGCSGSACGYKPDVCSSGGCQTQVPKDEGYEFNPLTRPNSENPSGCSSGSDNPGPVPSTGYSHVINYPQQPNEPESDCSGGSCVDETPTQSCSGNECSKKEYPTYPPLKPEESSDKLCKNGKPCNDPPPSSYDTPIGSVANQYNPNNEPIEPSCGNGNCQNSPNNLESEKNNFGCKGSSCNQPSEYGNKPCNGPHCDQFSYGSISHEPSTTSFDSEIQHSKAQRPTQCKGYHCSQPTYNTPSEPEPIYSTGASAESQAPLYDSPPHDSHDQVPCKGTNCEDSGKLSPQIPCKGPFCDQSSEVQASSSPCLANNCDLSPQSNEDISNTGDAKYNKPSTPNTPKKGYTGSFGGPPGILSKDDYSLPKLTAKPSTYTPQQKPQNKEPYGGPSYDMPSNNRPHSTCSGPDCKSSPSANGPYSGASATAFAGAGTTTGLYSHQPSLPSIPNKGYTGGFGGVQGTLGPNDYSSPTYGTKPSNYAPEPEKQEPHFGPSYDIPSNNKPHSTCSGPNCKSSSSTNGPYSGSSATTFAGAETTPGVYNNHPSIHSNPNKGYTGGFGGAPGILGPNEHSSPKQTTKPSNYSPETKPESYEPYEGLSQLPSENKPQSCSGSFCSTSSPTNDAYPSDYKPSTPSSSQGGYTGSFGGAPGILSQKQSRPQIPSNLLNHTPETESENNKPNTEPLQGALSGNEPKPPCSGYRCESVPNSNSAYSGTSATAFAASGVTIESFNHKTSTPASAGAPNHYSGSNMNTKPSSYVPQAVAGNNEPNSEPSQLPNENERQKCSGNSCNFPPQQSGAYPVVNKPPTSNPHKELPVKKQSAPKLTTKPANYAPLSVPKNSEPYIGNSQESPSSYNLKPTCTGYNCHSSANSNGVYSSPSTSVFAEIGTTPGSYSYHPSPSTGFQISYTGSFDGALGLSGPNDHSSPKINTKPSSYAPEAAPQDKEPYDISSPLLYDNKPQPCSGSFCKSTPHSNVDKTMTPFKQSSNPSTFKTESLPSNNGPSDGSPSGKIPAQACTGYSCKKSPHQNGAYSGTSAAAFAGAETPAVHPGNFNDDISGEKQTINDNNYATQPSPEQDGTQTTPSQQFPSKPQSEYSSDKISSGTFNLPNAPKTKPNNGPQIFNDNNEPQLTNRPQPSTSNSYPNGEPSSCNEGNCNGNIPHNDCRGSECHEPEKESHSPCKGSVCDQKPAPCAGPNCYPNSGAAAFAGAGSFGTHGTPSGTTFIYQKTYTGKFGGAPGILSPNNYDVPSIQSFSNPQHQSAQAYPNGISSGIFISAGTKPNNGYGYGSNSYGGSNVYVGGFGESPANVSPYDGEPSSESDEEDSDDETPHIKHHNGYIVTTYKKHYSGGFGGAPGILYATGPASGSGSYAGAYAGAGAYANGNNDYDSNTKSGCAGECHDYGVKSHGGQAYDGGLSKSAHFQVNIDKTGLLDGIANGIHTAGALAKTIAASASSAIAGAGSYSHAGSYAGSSASAGAVAGSGSYGHRGSYAK